MASLLQPFGNVRFGLKADIPELLFRRLYRTVPLMIVACLTAQVSRFEPCSLITSPSLAVRISPTPQSRARHE